MLGLGDDESVSGVGYLLCKVINGIIKVSLRWKRGEIFSLLFSTINVTARVRCIFDNDLDNDTIDWDNAL